jgi:hypothetical protein
MSGRPKVSTFAAWWGRPPEPIDGQLDLFATPPADEEKDDGDDHPDDVQRPGDREEAES